MPTCTPPYVSALMRNGLGSLGVMQMQKSERFLVLISGLRKLYNGQEEEEWMGSLGNGWAVCAKLFPGSGAANNSNDYGLVW